MKCHYDKKSCSGKLWQCRSCSEWYCRTHFHVTSLGSGVECSGCEQKRLANAEKQSVDHLKNIDARIDKLDIKEKP